MALAIDITDGCGLSNEACRWLPSKKSKVMLYFPQLKLFNQLYITNKTEHFTFKSGYAVRVTEFIKED